MSSSPISRVPSVGSASPNAVRLATEQAAAAAHKAGVKPSSSSLIPRFYVRGEGGRGRGRPLEEDRLEQKLSVIVGTWRTHWLEARKQALAAAREEGRDTSKLEGIQSAPATDGAPLEQVAGVELSSVDADLGLPVEQFAAVAKTLCGFPSFFAAPLFRRIRNLFGRASKGPAPGMDAAAAAKAQAAARKAQQTSATSSSSGSSAGLPGAGLVGRAPFAASPSLGCPVSHVDVVAGDTTAPDDSAARDIPAQGYDAETRGVIRLRTFLRFWRTEVEPMDQFGRFFNLVAQRQPATEGPHRGRRVIVAGDFMPFLEELLAFHPGLAFLESTPDFQEKYARTVAARIMFELDPEGSGAITERALRRSDLLHAFHTVDMEEDINLVTRFFSYEHFYVLYCKFWELDTDHDFLLDRDNLSAMPDLTHVVLDRVFSGAGRRLQCQVPGRMSYEDFVCFFLAEEDKTSETAIRYWFNVCDVDGDRVITPPDMAYFYKQQLVRMVELGNEPVKLEDVVTQMTDLLKPQVPGHFRLGDFLEPTRCRLTGVFFSTLFNLGKFLQFEAKDPIVVKQELNTQGISQWDRYASAEYLRLAEEEEEDEAAGAAVLGGGAGQMGGVPAVGMGTAIEMDSDPGSTGTGPWVP